MSMRRSQWIHAAAAAAALFTTGSAGALETRGALYGDLRLSLDYTDDSTGAGGPAYTATDNRSIWGLKFSTARGGVTVFGALERLIDADDPPPFGTNVEVTRQAYLGLTSLCGTLKFGRHATAYAEAGRKLDPFYNTAVAGIGGVATAGYLIGGNSHGTATAFNGDRFGEAFVADHLAYESPAFWGARANVAFVVDDSNNADQNHDYGAGLEWAGAGVTAGAQYLDANGANDLTWGVGIGATRLYAGYAQPRFGFGASWEMLDVPAGLPDQNYTLLSGWYGFRDDTRIAVSVGIEDRSFSEGDSLRAGLFHDVIENFTVWVAGRYYNNSGPFNLDSDVVTLGASYKFNLGFSVD